MITRDLKVLYEMILESYNFAEPMHGICFRMHCLFYDKFINEKEYEILGADFKSRRPNVLSHFWWNKNFNQLPSNSFWWTLDEKGDVQRKLFLQHIIDCL